MAFAAYHPWLIKKASVLAIYAAGTREQLTQSMNIKDFSELNNIAKFLVGLREALAKFYTDSGMADLPWLDFNRLINQLKQKAVIH